MSVQQENSGPKRAAAKNRETAVVTYFFLALFLGMMVYFAYFMEFRRESFINSPYNKLPDLLSERIVRGDIRSSDGVVLATTRTDAQGNETREYPNGRMFSHVVGYAVNGKAGLENQENFELLSSHEFLPRQILNDLRGIKSQGDHVITTLDFALQKTAYDALGDYDGAIIAMDPDTGKILCMVSKPDYDPNTVEENWDEINREGSSVLYNRATQGKYTPGSVFKMFTLLEYYKEHPGSYETYHYDCGGSIEGDGGYTIHCAGRTAHGEENLESSFSNSCNTSFANIATQLNVTAFGRLCDSLLFNTQLPIDFESTRSSFSLSTNDERNMVMQTGIGQGKTTVSPLHMMLVVSAAANGGTLMRPYLIDRVEAAGGGVVKSNSPKTYGSLLAAEEAAFLRDYMGSVVTQGTAGRLAGQSYTAYGKTGTAQVSDTSDTTNAWFAGYAEKDGRKLALAVVVEKAGGGSTYAVPIAKRLFDNYFN